MAEEMKITVRYAIAKHFIENPNDSARVVAAMFHKHRVTAQQVAAIKAHVTIGTYSQSRAFREWLVGKMFSDHGFTQDSASILENPSDSG